MSVSVVGLLGRLSAFVDLWFVLIATLVLISGISSGQLVRLGLWLEDLSYRLTQMRG